MNTANEQVKVIYNQASWVMENENVHAAITRLGGHMAPVSFNLGAEQPVEPYFINPWHAEGLALDEPVLVPLRGDFFCLPFGEVNTAGGEFHRVHGETAGQTWQFEGLAEAGDSLTLTLTMELKARAGKVTKRTRLVKGHTAIYQQHHIEGFAGKTSLGHHATLTGNKNWRISTAPFHFGRVGTGAQLYANEEYISLEPGAWFESLEEVPSVWIDPETSDCTIFPAREGFVDIAQVYFEPSDEPVWTCAVCAEEGFLWYSLKNRAVQPSMVLWMENHGRHGSPWNGRNACIGLEDVCAYFAKGLNESIAENDVNARGISTFHALNGGGFDVNYIQGVARIPQGFDRVKTVVFDEGMCTFISDSEKVATAAVAHEFVFSGEVR
jgi:hypothetical protein